MNFKTMTLEELQTSHSEMCSTALDLGLSVPPALALDFNTTDQGIAICVSLDKLIQKFREGLDTGDKTNSSGAGVAGGDMEEHTPQPEPASKKRAKSTKPVTEKMAEQKAARLARDAANPAPEKVPTKEKKVAKKAVAKKAVAKKAAKGAVAKKAATPRAGALDENAKITWVGIKGENPYRGDKGERYAKIMKGSGKTVKALLAAGVPSETLRNAIKNKIAKLGA